MHELSKVDCSIDCLSQLSPLDSNLSILRLHGNLIKYLEPSCLVGVSCLKILDISSNHLLSMAGIRHLRSLKILNLSNNNITQLEDLECLYNLLKLTVSYNPINSLIGMVHMHGNQFSLEFLDLRSTEIAAVPELYYLSGLIKLKHVYLLDSPISKDESYPAIIYSISKSVIAIDGLDAKNCSFPHHIDFSFIFEDISPPQNDSILQNFQRSLDEIIHSLVKLSEKEPIIHKDESLSTIQSTLNNLMEKIQEPNLMEVQAALVQIQNSILLISKPQENEAVLEEVKSLKNFILEVQKQQIPQTNTQEILENSEKEISRLKANEIDITALCLSQKSEIEKLKLSLYDEEKRNSDLALEIASVRKSSKERNNSHKNQLEMLELQYKRDLRSALDTQHLSMVQSKEKELNTLTSQYENEKKQWSQNVDCDNHQLQTLKNKVSELCADLETIKVKSREKEENLKEKLHEEQETHKAEIQSLREKHQLDLQQMNQELVLQHKNASVRVHSIEDECAKLTSMYQQQISQQQSEISRLQNTSNDAHSQLKIEKETHEIHLKNKLEEQRLEFTDLLKSQHEKIKDLSESLADLEYQNNKKASKWKEKFKLAAQTAVSEQTANLTQQIANKNAEIESLKSRISKKESAKREEKTQTENKQKIIEEITASKSQLEHKIAVQEKILEDQKSCIANLKQNLSAKVTEFQKLQYESEEFREMEYEIQQKCNAYVRMQEKVARYQKKRNEMKIKFEETSKRLEERNKDIEKIESEASRLQKMFSARVKQIEDEYNQKNCALEILCADQKNQINELRNHISMIDAELKSNIQKIKRDYEMQLEKLKLQVQEKEDQVQMLKSRYTSLSQKWSSVSEMFTAPSL